MSPDKRPSGRGSRGSAREPETRTLADLRGLTGSIANGFRVDVCGIPVPGCEGPGGTIIFGLEISGDRGNPLAEILVGKVVEFVSWIKVFEG